MHPKRKGDKNELVTQKHRQYSDVHSCLTDCCSLCALFVAPLPDPVSVTLVTRRVRVCGASLAKLEHEDVRVNKTDHDQNTSPNYTFHHQPTGKRREGSASYPQFVPGASEGELFGEVHTQYVQPVSSDNTEPFVLMAAHSTPTIHSASSHSHHEHRNPDSRDIHSSSYRQFVPGASEEELFGEVHTQYVQSVSSDK